jgi:hypothetical protein
MYRCMAFFIALNQPKRGQSAIGNFQKIEEDCSPYLNMANDLSKLLKK